MSSSNVYPFPRNDFLESPAVPENTPTMPSLAQVALVYRGNLERISAEMAKNPLPTHKRNGHRPEDRAVKLTMQVLHVTKRRVLEAVEAEREAGIEAFQAFREPAPLNIEHLGLDVSPSFARKLDRVTKTIQAAQRGPNKTLRALCDMLAFDLPVDPDKVRECIELCEKLLSRLTSLAPMALCSACVGRSPSGAQCMLCLGFGYVSLGTLASSSEDDHDQADGS